jgi:hypothetical protein
MKKFFFACLFFISSTVLIFGQSIFENPINGENPNALNPYTLGQTTDSKISVSGIGRGKGIFGINSNNRYNARSWKSDVLDTTAYFEFTISPNTDQKIDFVSFVFTGQTSINGPTLFAFRSSLDNFTSDIGAVTANGTTVSLSAIAFQDVVTPITFRLYGWAATTGTGTFSINDFQFNGVVSCAAPRSPALPQTSLSCSATSFTVNWPASLYATNYFIDVATDSGFTDLLASYQNKELGNKLSETIVGLTAVDTYYVRLRSSNSCETSSYSNIIKVAPPETIYDGTWSNGVPDATKKVRFRYDFNVAMPLEACSCQIDAGVAVHVESDAVLTLQNGLDIIGDGSLAFEKNASLIQVNDGITNTGKISYTRETAPMKNFDYTYWCSPVQDQVLNVLSPDTLFDKYLSYSNNKWVVEPATGTMNPPGKGFIIRVPKPQFWPNPLASTYIQKVVFTGIPNNGNYTLSIDPTAYSNLIGNPYPSALSADAFLQENSVANKRLDGTLRFWTHNTVVTNLKYSASDYASYTLSGGVAASSGGEKPNGYIAAGQSFFAKSFTDNEKVVFNNGMRVGGSGENTQFFRASKSKTGRVEKHRIWLNLTNAEGVFKQLLVGYIKGATNGFDNAFDAKSADSNRYADFYSVTADAHLVIQGRTLPFDIMDKVALGYKTAIDGNFAISIDQLEGVLSKCPIYLEDKNTGVLHDLKKSAYSFSTGKGEYNNRFVLHYLPNLNTIFAQEIVQGPKQQMEIYSNAGQLSFKSSVENIAAIFIYDLKGKLIYQKTEINAQQFTIADVLPKPQILIVKTVFGNGTIRTDKIVF